MLREELEATDHSTVPVYPPKGVTVTVDVPELPSETVRLVPVTENPLVVLAVDPIVRVRLPDEDAKVESPE